jgi:hypothetical protein
MGPRSRKVDVEANTTYMSVVGEKAWGGYLSPGHAIDGTRVLSKLQAENRQDDGREWPILRTGTEDGRAHTIYLREVAEPAGRTHRTAGRNGLGPSNDCRNHARERRKMEPYRRHN